MAERNHVFIVIVFVLIVIVVMHGPGACLFLLDLPAVVIGVLSRVATFVVVEVVIVIVVIVVIIIIIIVAVIVIVIVRTMPAVALLLTVSCGGSGCTRRWRASLRPRPLDTPRAALGRFSRSGLRRRLAW